MASYTIRPVQAGSILYFRGSFTSDPEQCREKEWFPVLFFLIEGGGRRILVDTGCGDPASESMRRCPHAVCEQRPEQRPDRALRALGVDPASIDTVVLTHLHWDHSYNNQFFPQAEFYVQRDELRYAVDPAPEFRATYEAFCLGLVPPWARQETKWHVVEGDCALAEGITLVALPGHTPGLQGVLVETDGERFLLPSDAIPLYDNFESGAFRLSGLCADEEAFRATFDKIASLHATIIPSHDARVAAVPVFPQRAAQ